MKHNYLFKLFLLVLFPFLSEAQTAVSITNGTWMNPTTWNCTCIPFSGYNVTINHTVTLDTPMSFTTGGLTISNTGALMKDTGPSRDLLISGGSFANNGKMNIRFFLVTAGTISNPGTFTVNAFTNYVSFSNSGTIQMDSLYAGANFTNTSTGKITGDSLTMAATFINDGRLNVSWMLNNGTYKNNNYMGGYAFTNANNTENNDSIIMTGSMWNKAVFTNKTTGKINLTKNFHNYNSSTTALFENNGYVRVFDSWYNTDTVKGSGAFTVTDTSANSGFMKGNFDFCDLSHPAPPPLVDLNSGSISSGITWCIFSGVKEYSKENAINVFPNPNAGVFTIEGKEEDIITIVDQLGQTIKTVELNASNHFLQTISDLSPGFYILRGEKTSARIVVSE
jgi:hypothetical protein